MWREYMKFILLAYSYLLSSALLAGVEPLDPQTSEKLPEVRQRFEQEIEKILAEFRIFEQPLAELRAEEVHVKYQMINLLNGVSAKSVQAVIDSDLYQAQVMRCEEVMNGQARLFEQMSPLIQKIDNFRSSFFKKEVRPLIDSTAFGIPSREAIATIAKYSPIVELGAGNGYWAHQIKDLEPATDILSYDDFSWKAKGMYDHEDVFEVLNGGLEMLQSQQNRQRNLLLIWPPNRLPFAFEALKGFGGEYLIYIGEMPGDPLNHLPSLSDTPDPAMADHNFFKALEADFDIIETLDLPHWPDYNDKLRVFRKKPKTLIERFLRNYAEPSLNYAQTWFHPINS